ncbi:MAG: protease inhibitor I42 family protein [Tatlockia sp.]|nr:protease inhibitor I42 family protein [Tatlockia sp.]
MKMFLSGFFLLFTFGANAADSVTMNINPAQKQFLITLPANPTTGYQWSLVNYDQTLLKLKESRFLASKSQLIGAGGKMRFKFEIIKNDNLPSKTQLLFKYQRPWESKGGIGKKVNINFVNPDNKN